MTIDIVRIAGFFGGWPLLSHQSLSPSDALLQYTTYFHLWDQKRLELPYGLRYAWTIKTEVLATSILPSSEQAGVDKELVLCSPPSGLKGFRMPEEALLATAERIVNRPRREPSKLHVGISLQPWRTSFSRILAFHPSQLL